MIHFLAVSTHTTSPVCPLPLSLSLSLSLLQRECDARTSDLTQKMAQASVARSAAACVATPLRQSFGVGPRRTYAFLCVDSAACCRSMSPPLTQTLFSAVTPKRFFMCDATQETLEGGSECCPATRGMRT
jgi:hypothetical protein